MSFLLGLPIFRGYVKFQGCNPFKHLSAAPKNAPSPPATIAPPFQGVHAMPLGGELYGVNHPRPWRKAVTVGWFVGWFWLILVGSSCWIFFGSSCWIFFGSSKLLDFFGMLVIFQETIMNFVKLHPPNKSRCSSCPQLFRMTHLSQNRFVPTFMPFRQRRRFWCRQGSWGKKSPAVAKVTKGRPQKLRHFPEELFLEMHQLHKQTTTVLGDASVANHNMVMLVHFPNSRTEIASDAGLSRNGQWMAANWENG